MYAQNDLGVKICMCSFVSLQSSLNKTARPDAVKGNLDPWLDIKWLECTNYHV